jgi:hypothetical protein
VRNSFEKWQVAACFSSKELCAKLRNVSTNRKKATALSPVFKRVLQIQRLLVLAAKNLLIQNKMIGRV